MSRQLSLEQAKHGRMVIKRWPRECELPRLYVCHGCVYETTSERQAVKHVNEFNHDVTERPLPIGRQERQDRRAITRLDFSK